MNPIIRSRRPLPWPRALTITLVLSGAVYLGMPHILIAPVWHSWPRAFLALGVGLLPVFWTTYLLFHCASRADWIIGGISGVLSLLWLAMSGNLVWCMARAFFERS